MRKSLILLFALLTLGVGLWAENPQGSPAGPIVYGDLHFRSVDNVRVELVKHKDGGGTPVPYKGDIFVPNQFEFTDTYQKVYELTVIWIDNNAFSDSPDLISVTLPATITKIGDEAFANGTNLISVTCLGTEPATLGTDAFADSHPTIYVPRGTVDTYKEAWSAYADLIRLTDLDQAKEDAIREIQVASEGIQNEIMKNWIGAAIADIPDMTTTEKVEKIKDEILEAIDIFKAGKAEGIEEGKAAGKAEALGDMGEPCTDCTAVEVTDGTTIVKLYNPTKVSYIKQE